jgi:hypothetical protein
MMGLNTYSCVTQQTHDQLIQLKEGSRREEASDVRGHDVQTDKPGTCAKVLAGQFSQDVAF